MSMHSWRELIATPAASGPADRETRKRRFATIFDCYRRAGGTLPRVVKITGTSGKGSVAAMLEAALRADGRRVGLFTGPHLVDATERIRIDGDDVTEAQLDEVATRAAPLFAAIEGALGPGRPTLFEALLVLALRAFAEAGVEIALLEVAIGGYHDVVSLIPGGLAVITSVGLDHARELGPSIAAVAADKAGIASGGSILVLGPSIDDEAEAVIAADAGPRGVGLVRATRAPIEARALGASGHEVRLATAAGALHFRLPLAGAFQLDNLASAVALFEQLQAQGAVTSLASLAGIAATRWPGRLELVPGSPAWLLDAAHNGLAYRALAEFLEGAALARPLVLLFGASEPDKAREGLACLTRLCDEVIGVSGFYKSAEPAELAAALGGLALATSPAEAMTRLLDGGRPGTIVVTGSLYLVGACRKLLIDRGLLPRSARP
jgi:dihydrofolate synthase/folylpolyglutamate synthase